MNKPLNFDSRSAGVNYLQGLVETWDDFPFQEQVVKWLKKEGYSILMIEVDNMSSAEFFNFLKKEIYEA